MKPKEAGLHQVMQQTRGSMEKLDEALRGYIYEGGDTELEEQFDCLGIELSNGYREAKENLAYYNDNKLTVLAIQAEARLACMRFVIECLPYKYRCGEAKEDFPDSE
jgi:hypothetical protein